jgi:hypothetical protein
MQVAACAVGRYNACRRLHHEGDIVFLHFLSKACGPLAMVGIVSMVSTMAIAATLGLDGAPALGATAPVAPAQDDKRDGKDQDRRPRLTLKVQPPVAIAPARILLTAELVGGANDFEEYYCPGVQWEWGDDTKSESTSDCPPFEAGKSEIRRRFTVEHVFRRGGAYKVFFRLKRRDKIVASATTTIQIRPGGQDF